jgi:hypothetical protein
MRSATASLAASGVKDSASSLVSITTALPQMPTRRTVEAKPKTQPATPMANLRLRARDRELN